MSQFDETIACCALNRMFGYAPAAISAPLTEGKFKAMELLKLSGSKLMRLTGAKSVSLRQKMPEADILQWSRQEIHKCITMGITPLGITSPEYPPLLKECPDAPLMLYIRGNTQALLAECTSVVGTRKASTYGIGACRDIVRALASRPSPTTIVSGLAYGIDIQAHSAAISAGIPTIAIMATGADRIYPAAHRGVAEQIVRCGGALVTDFPLGTLPIAVNFLRRNRIIAGISSVTIVAESPLRGGSMTTAHAAASYGRDVYAVPGRVTDTNSQGCNRLISSNIAGCIASMDCLEEIFGIPPGTSAYEGLSEQKLLILKTIKEMHGRKDTETVSRTASMQASEVRELLTEMEMEGLVHEASDGCWEAAIP